MTGERNKKAETAAWIGISGNAALALVKGVAGTLSGSKALLADALYSAAGVAGTFASIIGSRSSKATGESDRPDRAAKTESIATIIISVLMLIIGVEIGISSIKALYVGVSASPEGYALIVIVAALIAKEALFQYKYRLGKKLASQSLIRDAWEHRSDLYPSLAALAGVGGALLGKLLGLPYFYYLDPLGGLIVSIFILKMGYELLMESMQSSLARVLGREDAFVLMQTVQRVKGVITVNELQAREQGHYVIVDLKITVNPRITVIEGHEIAKEVRNMLMDRYTHVSDVLIQVHPYDPGYPYKNNLDLEQRDFPTMLH